MELDKRLIVYSSFMKLIVNYYRYNVYQIVIIVVNKCK